MRISKAQPVLGQCINIGGINLTPLPAITVYVANAQVVGENKDNVWPGGSVEAKRQQQG